ncbi:MAG: cell wall hydrolase [Hymenobacter sp.]|nr:MAG: cell wall hydrolase [Hymenobacter sp.]
MIDLPPPQVVCIAQAIYGEARGESDLGKRGVAHVILNRSKKFHKTPCEVLRQPGQFQIKLKRRYSGKAWRDAYKIAYYPGKDPTGGAIYFKHRKNSMAWGFKLTTAIGNHNFYK